MCIAESSLVITWVKQPSVHCVSIEIEIRVQCQWADTISYPTSQYKRQRGETHIMYHINSATNDLVLYLSILCLWITYTVQLYFWLHVFFSYAQGFVNRTQNTRTEIVYWLPKYIFVIWYSILFPNIKWCLHIMLACELTWQGPLLLTWFNFNPSLDK